MSEMGIDQVLAQMRAMSALAQGGAAQAEQAEQSRQADFAGLLKDSVGKVNEVQQTSARLPLSVAGRLPVPLRLTVNKSVIHHRPSLS